MTRKLALIPVDFRPVTYDLPKDLAEIADWELVTPPKEHLGFLKEPANFNELFKWIEEVSLHVEGFIVSIDMILYGGLVPSRINTDDPSVIFERLEAFLTLKRKNPTLKLMAFSSTMRLSNSYVNEEEKPYWDTYGKEIWLYSFHFHRYQKYQLNEDKDIMVKMEEEIPKEILADYIESRERNYQVNMSLIDYIQEELLDLLIFPQDDTSEYGLNILEQEKLNEKVTHQNLQQNIFIYPGADEVASVLTARMIYLLEKEPYPTFHPIYSGVKGSFSIAMYEDRPIKESVIGQIEAFGGTTVDEPNIADIIIGVNVPGRKQGDLALQINLDEVTTNDRNVTEWVTELSSYFDNGKSIAIADVAYANGADITMIPILLSTFTLKELSGFAAWNTAGNTIGTVVAQSSLIHLSNKKKQIKQNVIERQLLLRLLDDYLYQSIIRQKVRSELSNELNSDVILKKVNTFFMKEAQDLIQESRIKCSVEDIYLPWDRTFEIGLKLKSL